MKWFGVSYALHAMKSLELRGRLGAAEDEGESESWSVRCLESTRSVVCVRRCQGRSRPSA